MITAAEAAMLAGTKAVVQLREQDYAKDGKFDLTNAEIVAELDKVFKPFFEANFSKAGYELDPSQYQLNILRRTTTQKSVSR